MAIVLEKAEMGQRRGRKVANRKNRLLVTGKRKPRLVTKPNTVFIPNRSKLVESCIGCEKSFTEVDRKLIYGKDRVKRTNRCTSCWKKQAASNNEYRRKLWILFKKLYIQKTTGGCERCGFNDDYVFLSVFVFHHRKPKEKEGCVSTIIGSGYNLSNKKLFVKEARKCDVLCKNCHAIVHEMGGVPSRLK